MDRKDKRYLDSEFAHVTREFRLTRLFGSICFTAICFASAFEIHLESNKNKASFESLEQQLKEIKEHLNIVPELDEVEVN